MLSSTAQALTVMAVFLPLLRPNSMGMLQGCLLIHLKPCKRLEQFFWVICLLYNTFHALRFWPKRCSEIFTFIIALVFQHQ